jgi:valyl-tRNA synthetase
MAELQAAVLDVRRFRSDQGVKPAQRIPARLTGLERYTEELRALVRLAEPDGQFSPTAELSTGSGVRIELDLSTAIDVPAERARLAKDQAAASKELEQTGRKLVNEAFLANAKPEVVSSVRDRNAAARAELRRIETALAALPTAP